MSTDFKINKKAVQELAALLKETDLTEIEYETEHAHIRVKRTITTQQFVAAPQPAVAQPAVETLKKAVDPIQHPGSVKSPMVGTAYLSPDPESAAFVKIGDNIEKGQTLLIIEAMKVMNPIKATKTGRVIEICVTDAAPVEFNEVLLVIE